MSTFPEKDNVSTALSDLLQTLDDEKARLNEEVAQAMKNGEYDTATAVIQFTKRLLGFQADVEALVEKWEELNGIRDLPSPQVRHIVRTRVVQSNPPARVPRTQRTSYKGITESTAHCFHILDILEEMGGAVKNQVVSTAVNKRIKMLYPKFKEARAMLAQQGWTKKSGSNHTLEISEKGTLWLQKQKAQLTDGGHSEHIPPSSAFENVPTVPKNEMPENGVIRFVAPVSDDEDFDQI